MTASVSEQEIIDAWRKGLPPTLHWMEHERQVKEQMEDALKRYFETQGREK